ncbi:hypothetical protein Leryth_016132 [Lithospermum erythrorhizon]|nr:hypothetical protein Leryth_016132 [Lithospermum erythrorhizon]
MLEPVREHDASVLAGLMKGDDGNLAEDFIHRAYTEANGIHKRRKSRSSRSGLSATEIHGPVLALAACVLSVPYDMPSWLAELDYFTEELLEVLADTSSYFTLYVLFLFYLQENE